MKTRSPLIWFGGKSKVANEIINRMPDHKVYVEPFGGAAHVIAQKPEAKTDVYNDIDGDLVNFLLVARADTEKFIVAAESLPYSRQLYERWKREGLEGLNDFDRAIRFFYLNRSGISGGNNPDKARTGWRHSTTASQNPAKGYSNACQLIKMFSKRIQNVMIEHDDFKKIIEKYDSPDTLFYIDPPYIGREKYYAGGFTDQDHRELAFLLNRIQGKAIVSYYYEPILDELYSSWRQETYVATKQVVNGTSCKAEELLLMNFDLQPSLFDWEGQQ
jgi:DNA adenine methylase